MDEKTEDLRTSPEAVSYLGDVADQSLRSALEKSDSSIFSRIPIASVNKKNLLHNDDGLSPAGGIVEDGDGRLYLSDEFNHRICVYDEGGTLQESFGQKGSENGMLHYPRGLALDGNGNLYVADAWNHSISIFGQDHSFKVKIGSLGTGKGELDEPVGVVIIDDTLYVLEKSNHRIQAFTLSGEHVGFIGKRGSVSEQEQFYLNWVSPEYFCPPVFEFPSAIASDGKGNIFVADTNNHRIVKIDTSMDMLESEYTVSGIRYPSGLACDSEGNLHVTMFNSDTVPVYSPEGIRLYSYRPGLDVPLAIAIRGENVFISDGNKPGMARLELKSKHEREFSAEDRFGHHIKSALYDLKNENWAEGIRRLADATAYASADDPPDPVALGEMLPDNSYAFADTNKNIDSSLLDMAKPFARLLTTVSKKIFSGILEAIDEKAQYVDEVSTVSLNIEKSFLLGGSSPSNEDLLVERHRAMKKLYNKSIEIKKMLFSYKKVDEFIWRLAHIGVSADERLDSIHGDLVSLLGLTQQKDKWFEVANREAPSLSFTSPPDQRTEFLKNQNRIFYLSIEFEILCGFAAEHNRELAWLIKKSLIADEEKLHETVCASLDLFAMFPDNFTQHIEYFNSFETLFSALGEERAGKIALKSEDEDWKALLREENIPAAKGSPYRLVSALFSGGNLQPGNQDKSESWGKISDFYIGEFKKFINEYEPLSRELQQLQQQLPVALKTDPKQASEIEKKVDLLRFHCYFQERYITSMMREYHVRFAIFRTDSDTVDTVEARATLDSLEKIAAETVSDLHDVNLRNNLLFRKLAGEMDLQEKNRGRIENELLDTARMFYIALGGYLQPALASLKKKFEPDGGPIKPMAVYRGPCQPSTRFTSPTAITIDNKRNIYILSTATRDIYVTNEKGEPTGRFGGYGKMPGKTTSPFDMIITPDNELLVTEVFSNIFSLYSLGGKFLRHIEMQFPDGKNPYRVQVGSEGRLYTSHTDGKGISVFDRNGNMLKSISGEGIEIKGFSIRNDTIFTGGGGKFDLLDMDGTVTKSLQLKGTGFKSISSTDIADDGTFYAVDMDNNRLIKIDSGFTEVEPVKGIQTHSMSVVAVRGDLLAISDYFAETVMLFKGI